MQRLVLSAIVTVLVFSTASAGPLSLNPADASARAAAPLRRTLAQPPAETQPAQPVDMQGPGFGGFFEMLFRGFGPPRYEPNPTPYRQQVDPADEGTDFFGRPVQPGMNPRFMKQVVSYDGRERPGTVIIDTNERLLYLVQDGGTAIRYGIGVGRPGFTWAGVHHVSQKREWPDWTPPDEMLKRRPDLPRHMEGGLENPLGARALYLGSTLYRIHGSNEPWTIGTAVSSGCIRMRNDDVIDLYGRVRVGTKVVVI